VRTVGYSTMLSLTCCDLSTIPVSLAQLVASEMRSMLLSSTRILLVLLLMMMTIRLDVRSSMASLAYNSALPRFATIYDLFVVYENNLMCLLLFKQL
jgi:hypothetical protein